MDSLVIYFAVAAIATLSATELVRVLAMRLGAMDRPGGRRVHRAPTARLGGLGIFWGVAVSLLLAAYTRQGHASLGSASTGLFGLLGGAGVMLITGLVDDVRGLPAPVKLALQMVAASLVYWSGWRIDTIGIPGVGSWPVGGLSLALTVGWIVVATNAINLIDGLDGLATGIGLIAALAVLLLVGPTAVASRVMAVALAGALLGFLWFNAHPALIFMGDAGSLFVGFTIAALTLRVGMKAGPEAFPIVPMLVIAVPLFDTLSAVVRRLRRSARASASPIGFLQQAKKRVMSPDRSHLHHRLIDAGFSSRTAVLLMHLCAASFALAAWVVSRHALIGAGVVTVVAVGWARGFRAMNARAARPIVPVMPASLDVPGLEDDTATLVAAGLEAEAEPVLPLALEGAVADDADLALEALEERQAA